MRLDYSDPRLRRRVYDLLDTSFHRLSERIRIATEAGAPWHEISTAFVAWDGELAVAHAGVLSIPMVVEGERRTVAGVHAVCTRPEYRGRGLMRQVMEEALAHVDEHFDAALLDGEPGLYTRYGFRFAPERVFVVRPPPLPSRRPARRLSIGSDEDRALAWRLLEGREPVSDKLAPVDPGWLLVTDEALASFGFSRLYHAEDLDALLAFDHRGRTLRLLDVAAPALPSLAELLATVPAPFEEVEVHFTPDKVWDGPLSTRDPHPDDTLMLRGDLDPTGDFILSPLARC